MTNDHTTRDIVQKLWSLCNVLRDDGITYQAYVTELSWLQQAHKGAHGNADLVAHFFRRAFDLLRDGGSLPSR